MNCFFGAKWDDFWYIERMWAIYSQQVYRNPRPTHIDAVMRRLRDEVRNTDPNTLIRLCHELPAKMNEVFRLKGKKFFPTLTLESRNLRASARSPPPNQPPHHRTTLKSFSTISTGVC